MAKVTFLFGLKVTFLFGLKVTFLFGLKVTFLFGLKVTFLFGCDMGETHNLSYVKFYERRKRIDSPSVRRKQFLLRVGRQLHQFLKLSLFFR